MTMMLGFLGGLEVLLVFLFGGLISLACFALWIWMLIDCLTNHGIQSSEKVAWVLVILFLPFIGSLIYLFVGRPKRKTAS
jgi:Phospholipase_D-nuclease N-terminal